MVEVIDLLDSSGDEASVAKPGKDIDEDSLFGDGGVVLNSDDDGSVVLDLTDEAPTQSTTTTVKKRSREDDSSAFEREVMELDDDEEEEERPLRRQKKKANLSPSEKARRAAKRAEDRERKKAEKAAQKAAEMSAFAAATRVDLRLRCSSALRREWPALVELLSRRGFELERDVEGSRSILEWLERKDGWVPSGHRIVIVDMARLPRDPTLSLRELVADLEEDAGRPTVALVGPERERLFPIIAWLEDQIVTVRSVIAPKVGRDPDAKATAKLAELVQAHTNAIVETTKDARRAAPKAADLFSGLDVKDLGAWHGAKPRTSAKSWPAFLASVVPANCAAAVSAEYPSYRRLHDAVKTHGAAATADLTNRTASGQRIGPALANRLVTVLTSRDPDAQPQPAR